mmetsp:Transcript_20897/g.50462  ORF Transcript_20897/g.50462 Transcript_20897/m.50462 type:complete len:498 (+) Transcript_20897:55-1548(+)
MTNPPMEHQRDDCTDSLWGPVRDGPCAISGPSSPGKKAYPDALKPHSCSPLQSEHDCYYKSGPPGPRGTSPHTQHFRGGLREARSVGGSWDESEQMAGRLGGEGEGRPGSPSGRRANTQTDRSPSKTGRGAPSAPKESSIWNPSLLFAFVVGGGMVGILLMLCTDTPMGFSAPQAAASAAEAAVAEGKGFSDVGQDDALGWAWWFLLVAMVICTLVECLRTPSTMPEEPQGPRGGDKVIGRVWSSGSVTHTHSLSSERSLTLRSWSRVDSGADSGVDSLDSASRDFEITPLFKPSSHHVADACSAQAPTRDVGARGEASEATEEEIKAKKRAEEDREWPCLHHGIPHPRPSKTASGQWVPFSYMQGASEAQGHFECRNSACRYTFVGEAGGERGRTQPCPRCGSAVGACCMWRSNAFLIAGARSRRKKTTPEGRLSSVSAGNSPMAPVAARVADRRTAKFSTTPSGGASMSNLMRLDDNEEVPTIAQLKASIAGMSI